MDQKGNYIIETAINQTHNYYLKKTLQFLVPIPIIISFMYFSYFNSGFHPFFFFFFHDLEFPTLIFPFLAQALDRKCMFLICIGILAFLANNLKLNTTSSLNHGGFMKSIIDEDCVKQIVESQQIYALQENAAFIDQYVDTPIFDDAVSLQQEEDDDHGSFHQKAEEIDTGIEILVSEEWGEEEEEEDVVEERENVEDALVKEEVNDMRVSTEEMNKKFEEFIRRMKEEIRIEARQQYMIAV